ncbi:MULTISPECIES: GntR family transcriptional regulator [Rhodococcus]|uniref:GntR family transcriptional regulator n=1 Tax=Rhodococcus rhodochrous TaxID=1829 RepID=A0AA47AAR9_RHORH|nr:MULTISPECIES: GntR family transcriptional regulator [Rhodococcus]MDC3727384.1 GntR family transcriptional regulator [Rhodococcus sp. Rp3]UZF44348.1 GntR family transcriptional regulator [Rhodococcus rhodochrous]WSE21903.1 GntR family transcriptional regulator [Rhodococcus sp. PD04]
MPSVGSRHRSLRDETVDELRRLILDGELQPGERLSELNISDRLGVSRLPVREAFRRLEAEGLVESLPRRGVRVVELDQRELDAVREMRVALELIAVRRTIETADPEVRDTLRRLLDEGRAAETRGDREALDALNDDFHEVLSEGGGSRFLADVLRSVRNQARHLVGGKSTAVEPSWSEHAAIITATLDRDSELAMMLMRRHLTERHVNQGGADHRG